MFKTIKNNVTAEITEKKSKFIGSLFYVESVEEAEKIIKEIKKKYYDARHNCFAYIIEKGNIRRFSDDGEPSGTAGAPMLNILEGKGLSNTLVIVTRYFGGILLGTGGLVRAYSEATGKAIDTATIIQKINGYEAEIFIDYKDLSNTNYYLNKEKITICKTEYLDKIKITIEITNDEIDKLKKKIEEKILKIEKIQIIREKFIEKTPINTEI